MKVINLDDYRRNFEYFCFCNENFDGLIKSITDSFNEKIDGDFNSYLLHELDFNYNKYIDGLVSSGAFNYILNEYLFQNYDGSNLMLVLNDFFDSVNYYPDLVVAKTIVLKSADLQKLFSNYHEKVEDNSTAFILYSEFCEILDENPELVKSNSRRSVPLFFDRKGIFDKIKSGDLETRNDFLLQNLGLVGKAVNSFTSDINLREDYYQTGCLALIKAMDRFDFTKGVKFSTYAYSCIINNIYNYYGQTSYSFYLPSNIRYLISKYEKLNNQYELRGEKLDDDIACDILGVNSKMLDLLKKDYHAVSIYGLFNRAYPLYTDTAVDDSFLPIVENIADDYDMSSHVENKFLQETIDKIIDDTDLTDKEMSCLLAYFGFEGNDQNSVSDICRSSYYAYKERALKKISSSFEMRGLVDFLDDPTKAKEKIKQYRSNIYGN